jgi:hypothetical protein
MIKSLTDPLTAKELEKGLYTPPVEPRIAFTGTLDDAQTFYQKTSPVTNCRNCPIAQWTDGLPIIVPTEQKVKEMLTGTSHKADEVMYLYSMNTTTKQVEKRAAPLLFTGMGWTSTVEKVAINAVMAGCKPEFLPVVLSAATTGGWCPGTSGPRGAWLVVSGPIAKEIGMNTGNGAFNPGNPANSSIGRASLFISYNLGGCTQGVVRTESGNPIAGLCFAEDDEALPVGWETLREEAGYKKTENVLGSGSTSSLTVDQYKPSSFRGLVSSGAGGMARRIGVEGKPGPHNFLEYVAPLCYTNPPGGVTFVMCQNMADSLKAYGFKTKAEVYSWLWNNNKLSIGDWEKYGDYDFVTAAGENREPTSGIKYKDLADDYMMPFFGSTANANCILVAIHPGDELCWQFGGRPAIYPIDPWK